MNGAMQGMPNQTGWETMPGRRYKPPVLKKGSFTMDNTLMEMEDHRMKVFMIGGTGLLGSEAAKVLIERGHEVTAMALPPLPQNAVLPPEMKIEYGNYLETSDAELRACLTGCDGFVFAAGVDERVEGPAGKNVRDAALY